MVDLKPLLQSKIVKISVPLLIGISLAFITSHFSTDDWLNLEMEIQNIDVETAFDEAPIYVGSLDLPSDELLQPYAMCSTDYFYFVAYLNNALVDVFDKRFKHIKRLDLTRLGKGAITGIDADNTHIYITDSQSGDIRMYTHSGELVRRIVWLPDYKSKLRPHGITLFDGVLYVTDRKLQQVMAINIMDKPGISEPGELIFSAPRIPNQNLEFFAPGFCTISPDGRLLVSTLNPPNIRVFTCSGRDIGLLINADNNHLKSPQGIAFDQIPAPRLLARADSIFDPSGMQRQGRMHVADRETGLIHVYDPTGLELLSYGSEVISPINLEIDNKKRLIIVTDLAEAKLKFYKF